MENQENGMKVFFNGDSIWYASPWEIEKTKEWLIKELYLYYDFELEECNIDTEGMWIGTEDKEDIERLGDSDEIIRIEIVNGMHKRKLRFGNLERNNNYRSGIAKYTSFRDVLKMHGHSNKPYEIATTKMQRSRR